MVQHLFHTPDNYLPPETSEPVEMVQMYGTPIPAYLEPGFESDFRNEASIAPAVAALTRTSTSEDDSDNISMTLTYLQPQTTYENPITDEFSASQTVTTRGQIMAPKKPRYRTWSIQSANS